MHKKLNYLPVYLHTKRVRKMIKKYKKFIKKNTKLQNKIK